MSFYKTLDRIKKKSIIIINKDKRTGDIKNEHSEKNDFTWLYEMGYWLSFCSHLQQNWTEKEDYTQGTACNETGIEKDKL